MNYDDSFAYPTWGKFGILYFYPPHNIAEFWMRSEGSTLSDSIAETTAGFFFATFVADTTVARLFFWRLDPPIGILSAPGLAAAVESKCCFRNFLEI